VKKFANPLAVMIGIEVLVVMLMMLGVLPREAALFLVGIFAFFVIFAPLKQAVLFAVFSIPFYTALPITESFDSMAAWRIIVAILFLRVFVGTSWVLLSGSFSPVQRLAPRLGLSALPPGDLPQGDKTALKSAIKQYPRSPLARLGVLVGLFFVLGMLSLFVAPEPIFGIKKLLYLANIFALFFVIREVVRNKQDFVDVLKYALAGSVLTLSVAYAQFIAILFVPLYIFWQWWASHVIPVFYGANLGVLLSYSNTWFSYYEEAEATLRVFSFFPDSHSFALSMVLALPVALTFLLMSRGRTRLTLGAFVIFALLAIIFSGTRGVWIGAVPVFAILLILGIFGKKFFKMQGSDLKKLSVIKITIILFIIFALLFPVSSQLLKFSQMRQGGIVSKTSFERISTSFSARELSNLGRIQIWKSTFESIAKRPFLGVGIGNYPVVLNENVSATKEGASAHSLYLDVASEMGILAAIILLFMFLEILWRAIKVFLKNEDLILSTFAGFFAIYFLWVMAYSMVDVVLLNDKVLLLFVTLVALLYARIYNHRSAK